MRIDDELIEQTLRNASPWQPPSGFADRVASRAAHSLLDHGTAPRLWSFANVAAAVPLAVLTAVAGYFIGGWVDVLARETMTRAALTTGTTWIWVAMSYAVAAWFTLRPYSVD